MCLCWTKDKPTSNIDWNSFLDVGTGESVIDDLAHPDAYNLRLPIKEVWAATIENKNRTKAVHHKTHSEFRYTQLRSTRATGMALTT